VKAVFLILAYDLNEKRVAKALKICRKYLFWVQNSVFEGDISEAKLEKLKSELRGMMNTKEDSVIIYNFQTTKYSSVAILGLRKGGQDTII
jgi:CRISPR-associated protein Cas2